MVADIEEIIKNHELETMKKLISEGVSVNTKINVEGWGMKYPVNCALMHKDLDMVRLFVDNNARLNDSSEPAIVYGAIYGNRAVIQYLLENGADIDLYEPGRDSALYNSLSHRNLETATALIDNGININLHGGAALRYASYEGYKDIAEMLIKKGADINFNGEDMVFANKSTPLNCAVRQGHFEITNLLLENGADVSKTDEWGTRAYHEAKSKKNTELAELIKKYEPKEWHEYEWCVKKLKSYFLPDEVIAYLGTENKRLDLPKSECTSYVEFCTVYEVRIFTWNDIMFLDLVSNIYDYDETGVLSWLPERKCFGCLDIEHDKFGIIKRMKWKKFLRRPEKYIDGSLSWEYCEDDDDE